MHQNGDYRGIWEYFVNTSVFCSLKKKTQENQIKTSSSSFVFLKSICQNITAIYFILDQTIFNSLEEENLASFLINTNQTYCTILEKVNKRYELSISLVLLVSLN